MPYNIILYFRLPYFHVSNSAIFSTQFFSTLILYTRSLDTFYCEHHFQAYHRARVLMPDTHIIMTSHGRYADSGQQQLFVFHADDKETSIIHLTWDLQGSPPITGGFPSQKATDVESVGTGSKKYPPWLPVWDLKWRMLATKTLPWKDMMTSSNGNIFRVTGHLCGEFTGLRWIPHTKACEAELWWVFLSASE